MPAGGIFSNALFSRARGEATMFIPCDGPVRAIGRIIPRVMPAVELATLVRAGPHPFSKVHLDRLTSAGLT